MSEIFRTTECTLLDHRNYISKVYTGVENCKEPFPVFTLKSKLFCIKTRKKSLWECAKRNRKRPHNSQDVLKETTEVKQAFEEFIHSIPENIRFDIKLKYDLAETDTVRELAQKLFESTLFEHVGFSGKNDSSCPIRTSVNNDGYFFIPGKSSFQCGDVKEQCAKLLGSQFDLVLADPPWWNKYIRRLKGANDKLSYKMMYNSDIASIPMEPLLAANCVVGVWCTNAAANIAAVRDLIFPAWGVQYLTTWYWIKVTIDLEPVCDFSAGCKKQPYERLILGKRGQVNDVPQNQLFVSIPSALHSHKPPLLDLLKPYIPTVSENPRVLELFARYLLPNTTSVGLEPLKLTHESLYEHIGNLKETKHLQDQAQDLETLIEAS